jgi:hypothetical protein
MSNAGTRDVPKQGALTEAQWHELVRSLIDDSDAPKEDDRGGHLSRSMADSVGECE